MITQTEAFVSFGKIPRLQRRIIVTEKLDGTNAQIFIKEDGEMLFGSRNRWITPDDDNFGFAAWATQHRDELAALGPGRHFGEWWGHKIGRGYGLQERRFSLFNTGRWATKDLSPDQLIPPECCQVVPVLYDGLFDSAQIQCAIDTLAHLGSLAAPGFSRPEGIIVYHVVANSYFKQTIEKDEQPKAFSK